jgi:carbamoyltransferase
MRADRDYPLAQPQGRKRIVLLGDSYSAGDGVSNGKRFCDLLEQQHPHLDVLNFAVNGTGTDQQFLAYESKAGDYEHDAILWGICVENIARNMCTCRPSFDFKERLIVYRPKPYFTLEGGRLELRNNPVPLEKRPTESLGDWTCSFPYLPEHPDDAYAIYRYPDRPHWRIMEAIIRRLFTLAGDKPVFIVPLPMFNHYLEELPASYWPAFQTLEDISAKRYIVNILPDFQCLPMAERNNLRFPDDPHYTARAHAIVAAALERTLAERCQDLLKSPLDPTT